MRWLAALLPAAVLAATAVFAAPAAAPSHSPGGHAKLALAFLRASVPEKYWCQVRFLSLYATPDNELDRDTRSMFFWLGELSGEPKVTNPKEVPGSDGRLFYLFLDDCGWNKFAFQAVTTREPFFRVSAGYPGVDEHTARKLREAVGVRAGDTLHAEAIIRGDWLTFEASDTNRTPTYYDLLYARFRFEKKYFPAGTEDGQPYAAGNYVVFRDFPKDEAEFDFAWGVDATRKVLADKKRKNLQADNGVIVDEGESFVAYHDRLLQRRNGPVGDAWKTFDFKNSVGPNDLLESVTNAAFPENLKPDASEYIYRKPNGGQAYLLTVEQGKKRAEFADPVNIARDGTDNHRPVVIQARSCAVCHARGIQVPVNALEEGQRAGIDLLVKDREVKRRIEAFLLLPLGKIVKSDQERYAEFVERTSGRTPEANAVAYHKLLTWYEGRLTPEQMARECGVDLAHFKDVARKTGQFRLNAAVQGKGWMPRDTWDRSHFSIMINALGAEKGHP